MNCFLSSVATNGYDERGFKIENVGPTSSSFNAMRAKITKQKFKNSRVVLPGENILIYFFHNSTGSFFLLVKALKVITSAQNWHENSKEPSFYLGVSANGVLKQSWLPNYRKILQIYATTVMAFGFVHSLGIMLPRCLYNIYML